MPIRVQFVLLARAIALLLEPCRWAKFDPSGVEPIGLDRVQPVFAAVTRLT